MWKIVRKLPKLVFESRPVEAEFFWFLNAEVSSVQLVLRKPISDISLGATHP